MNYIFDFDGTIMDTSAIILATIKATVKDMDLPEKTEDEYRCIIGIRTDEAGKYLYPDLEISNEEFAKVFRLNYDRLRKDSLEQPFPGVIDTLRTLKSDGCKMAIASSRRLSSLYDYLDKLGIEDWFDMIVGADSVTNGKPNPEPVLKILDKLGWNADDTLVIGDADVDIMMGNAAGCQTAAVTYGNGSVEALKSANPDFMITTFPEILHLSPTPQF